MLNLIAACIAFVGGHFLLSHPLRATLVARIGEKPFLGLYSLISFATLGWMAEAYRRGPVQVPWWSVGDALWIAASAIMLLAAILLAGSFFGNPAVPGKVMDRVPAPRGVFAITRHPMNWSFALWAVAHMLVFPTPAQFVLAGAILVLALGGSAGQDAKKAALQPEFWPRWERVTSFWPFVAVMQGRAQWAAAWPGTTQSLLGIIIWLGATWAHGPLAGIAAGIWRWMN